MREKSAFPASMLFPGRFHVSMPAGLRDMMCRWEVREVPGGLEIEFDPEDVRPRERLVLEHVPLLVTADAKAELTVEWTAAGLSAEGSVSGRFVLPVVDSTLQALTSDDLGKWGLPVDEPKEVEQVEEDWHPASPSPGAVYRRGTMSRRSNGRPRLPPGGGLRAFAR
ncbi:hypothetical protein [Actinomadura geliboluensis]|uniref:hypothetical protein n=1 Tax=Actinomadura geliboluensis TaxID=882440 RepID=UPI00368E83DA